MATSIFRKNRRLCHMAGAKWKAEMWNFTPGVIKKIAETMEQLNNENIQPTLKDLKLKILN